MIELHTDTVVWRDFGYQDDYDPFEAGDVVPGVGPIVLDRQGYLEALEAFNDRWPDAGVGSTIWIDEWAMMA